MGSEIYEKNLAVLKARFPDIAERMIRIERSESDRLIRTSGGHPNILVGSGENGSGRYLYYDPEDPFQSAGAYLESLKIKYAPIVVFLGMGLGYHLDYFIRNLGQKWETREIVVYESDPELFRTALTIGDCTATLSHPNIHFVVGADPEESFYHLRTSVFVREAFHVRSLKTIALPPSAALNPSYYLRAVETVKKAATQLMVLVGNDSFDALVGVENMLVNLKHIFSNPGIIDCFEKFKGKPGVLVAAGPSLNKNMHLLKDIRDKALIFACDTSLIPMLKKGIRPHLVTSIERQPGTELYYSGLQDMEGIYFLAMAVLTSETIEAFPGKKFIGYRSYPHYGWLESDKGAIGCGMSVANLAFKALECLGCDPIILIGQDLAYAESGDTHVKGNVYGPRDCNVMVKPVIEIEGNDGRMVKSEQGWERMKYVYEENIADYPGTCINATEGGAKIRGARVMTFRQAIDSYCRESFHPQSILDSCHASGMGKVHYEDDMTRIQLKSESTRKRLDELIEDFGVALSEARCVQAEVIRPFLDGSSSDVPMDRLLSVEEKWVKLGEAVLQGDDLYQINAQTLQAYDVWLSCELSFLKDIYSNKTMLSMARVQKMTDWFSVIGSLLIFTRDALKRTEERISLELKNYETDTIRTADHRQ